MAYKNHLFSREIRVDSRGHGAYTSIKAACDYAATISPRNSSNFVLIRVNAGYYVENDFTVPTYTSVVGVPQAGEVDTPGVYIAPSVTAITGARSAFITLSDWSALSNVTVKVWTGSVSGLSADFGVVKATDECWINNCKISIALAYSGAFDMCAVLGTGSGTDSVRLNRSTIETAGGTSSVAVKTSQRIESFYCQLTGSSNIGYYSSTSSVSRIAFGRLIDDLDSPQVTAVHQTGGTVDLISTRVPLNMRSGSATFNEIQPTPQQLETALRAQTLTTQENYTMDAYADGTAEADAAGIVIKLPPPDDTIAGQAYVVKNKSAGAVTVDGNGTVFDLRSTLNDGIIAHWSMDELSGTRFDSVGSNDLVDNNTVDWRAGLVKNAASFTAASAESLSIADNTEINVTGKSFSWSMWVYNDSIALTYNMYATKYTAAGAAFTLSRYSDNKYTMAVHHLGGASPLQAQSTVSPATGEWLHIFGAWDDVAKNVMIRVNDESLVSVNFPGTTITDPAGSIPLYFGQFGYFPSDTATYPHDGGMDNVTLYNRVLTAAEQDEIFAYGAPSAHPFPARGTESTLNTGVVCHWSMDEVSGQRADSVGTTTLFPINAPLSDTGLVNLAGSFLSAGSQYLAASDSAEIGMNGTDFTWSMWVKSSSYAATQGTLLSKRNGSTQEEFELKLDPGTGKIVATVYNLGVTAGSLSVSSTTAPVLGEWYHILVEWDDTAKQLSVSIDKEAYSSGTSGGLVISDKVADFRMGSGWTTTSAYSHDGLIDNVTFYKRKLTADEHTEIFAKGAPSGYRFAPAESRIELPETNNFLVAQKSAAGTWNVISSDLPIDATDVGYTPTTPGDWVDPDPDDVQEGLDDLAAALNSLVNAHSVENWTFTSPSGVSGTFYAGGYYSFAATHNDFSPVINFGTANSSYAAHVLIVVGAVPVDTVTITVTGTSINDLGVRTTSDTENIVLTTGNLVNDYLETSKKFIGLVTIEAVSGTAVNCNYGWCKYFDNDNTDFIVKGSEATWRGGASDAGADLRLRHHKATGWTYNAGATPTPPTAIASLVGDHSTESEIKNNEEGAWKRTNFATSVAGAGSEGVLLEIVTTSAKTFELGNFSLHFVED